MNNEANTVPRVVDVTHSGIEMADFIRRVYQWMTIGLAVTGIVAYFVAHSQYLLSLIFGVPFLFYGLLILELILVVVISRAISKFSASTSGVLFFIYSILQGLTLSVIFLVYTESSIASVFFITAATFAAMSIYGYVTKTDLTKVGNIAFMALIGLIIASLMNLFLKNEGFASILSYLGVLIFVALTAYDTQKIKQMNLAGISGTDQAKKGAIFGALQLYLDFINLFLNLLRILGGRRK